MADAPAILSTWPLPYARWIGARMAAAVLAFQAATSCQTPHAEGCAGVRSCGTPTPPDRTADARRSPVMLTARLQTIYGTTDAPPFAARGRGPPDGKGADGRPGPGGLPFLVPGEGCLVGGEVGARLAAPSPAHRPAGRIDAIRRDVARALATTWTTRAARGCHRPETADFEVSGGGRLDRRQDRGRRDGGRPSAVRWRKPLGRSAAHLRALSLGMGPIDPRLPPSWPRGAAPMNGAAIG